MKFKSEDVDKMDALCERGREQVKALLRNAGMLEEPKAKKRWKALYAGSYLYVTPAGGVGSTIESSTPFDERCHKAGNYFQHEEDAKALSYILRLHTFLFAENVRLYGRYWQPDKHEYFYRPDPANGTAPCRCKSYKHYASVVEFKTEADAKEAYDNLPQDLKDYFKEKE